MMVFKTAKHSHNAFTLVELLVALVVTSIVLTAVATLAFALGTANDSADDTSRKQAQVRFATLRLSELIRHSRLIHDTSDSDVVLWRVDNDGDDQIDPDELVYIEAGPSRDYILLRESGTNPVILIPQCRNVQFVLDSTPPDTKSVSILFELEENGVWHKYQISATVRCKAG